MSAVKNDQQVVRNLESHPARGHVLGFPDFFGQCADEFAEGNDLGLLPVATIQLQHFADNAIDAFGVAADHAQKTSTFGGHSAVLLQQLRRLIDRREWIADLVRDRCRQAPHGRQFDLLSLGLCATQVLEVDERAAIQSSADTHEPHTQQPLGRLDLEWREYFGEVFLPASPVIVQRGAELGKAHPAAHAAEATKQPGDLGVVAAHDAVQVDDQHAVLHVLNDQPVDLLEVGDVDTTLRREFLGLLGVPAERNRNADGGKVPERDDPGLEHLRQADHAFRHAKRI